MCSVKGWAMLIQDNSEKWLHSYRRVGVKFLPRPSRPYQSHSQWPFKAKTIICKIKVWKPALTMQMIFSQQPESWPSSIWICGLGWGSPMRATWLDHLHIWKVCSTWEKVLMCSPGSAIWEKKKKKSGEDETEGYLQLQIEWLKESAGDRSLWAVVGLKGKHRSAPLLFWLLLLWSPLEGIGSPLNRILFPHGCHRAHPPFLQTCLVKPVATCYSFSTEYMYTSVCFAKVKMPSKESVMQETFWMMEQGTAVNYLIQFTRLSGVGGWNLGMWSSPRWWITGVYAKSALLITLPCFLMQDKETKKSL